MNVLISLTVLQMNNKQYMRQGTTFSLKDILDNQFNPAIYRQMLHQIKSPLMQQSLVLTQDNSVNISNDQPPKRPKIPPPPTNSPHVKKMFSPSHSAVQISIFENLYRVPKHLQYRDQMIESIVSPLHPDINHQNLKQSGFNICGSLFDSLAERNNEIFIEVPMEQSIKKKKVNRKPIFQQPVTYQNKSDLKKNEQINSQNVSLAEAQKKLQIIQEYELALFLNFLKSLGQQCNKFDYLRKQSQQQLCRIYRQMSQQSQFIPQQPLLNDHYAQILKRLSAKNSFQVLNRIRGVKFNKKQLDEERKTLENMFQILARLQIIISQFIKKDQSIGCLSYVYDFLSQNFGAQPCLLNQFIKLFKHLQIQQSEINLADFELIWHNFDKQKISKDKFLQSVLQNDLIFRRQDDFETDLESRGFQRNI